MTNSLTIKPAIMRENLPTAAITFTHKYGHQHLIRSVKFVQKSWGLSNYA